MLDLALNDPYEDAQIAAMQLSQMVTYLRSGMREAREMVINYGAYGEEANERNAELFARMQGLNPENAAKWEQIMALWKEVLEYHGIDFFAAANATLLS